jgi:DNA-directed RNA polymerase beta' subunit
MDQCMSHTSHIELFHSDLLFPMHTKVLKQMLQLICYHCSRLLFSPLHPQRGTGGIGLDPAQVGPGLILPWNQEQRAAMLLHCPPPPKWQSDLPCSPPTVVNARTQRWIAESCPSCPELECNAHEHKYNLELITDSTPPQELACLWAFDAKLERFEGMVFHLVRTLTKDVPGLPFYICRSVATYRSRAIRRNSVIQDVFSGDRAPEERKAYVHQMLYELYKCASYRRFIACVRSYTFYGIQTQVNRLSDQQEALQVRLAAMRADALQPFSGVTHARARFEYLRLFDHRARSQDISKQLQATQKLLQFWKGVKQRASEKVASKLATQGLKPKRIGEHYATVIRATMEKYALSSKTPYEAALSCGHDIVTKIRDRGGRSRSSQAHVLVCNMALGGCGQVQYDFKKVKPKDMFFVGSILSREVPSRMYMASEMERRAERFFHPSMIRQIMKKCSMDEKALLGITQFCDPQYMLTPVIPVPAPAITPVLSTSGSVVRNTEQPPPKSVKLASTEQTDWVDKHLSGWPMDPQTIPKTNTRASSHSATDKRMVEYRNLVLWSDKQERLVRQLTDIFGEVFVRGGAYSTHLYVPELIELVTIDENIQNHASMCLGHFKGQFVPRKLIPWFQIPSAEQDMIANLSEARSRSCQWFLSSEFRFRKRREWVSASRQCNPFNFYSSLSSKSGIIRDMALGKRCDQTFRAVLTTSPRVAVGEVHIGGEIARHLTRHIQVTASNLHLMQTWLDKLLAAYHACPRGQRSSLAGYWMLRGWYHARNNTMYDFPWNVHLLQSQGIVLCPGDALEVVLCDGAIIIINRPPTLRPTGLFALRVRVMHSEDKVLCVSPVLLKAMNADIDGDVLIGHVLTSPEGQIDAANRLSPASMLATPQYNENSLCLIQDLLLALYCVTCDDTVRVSWQPFSTGGPRFLSELAPGQYIARELLWTCFPPDFTYTDDEEGGVRFFNGAWQQGTLTKKHLGCGGKSLFVASHARYGAARTIQLLDDLTDFAVFVLGCSGISLRVCDFFLVGVHAVGFSRKVRDLYLQDQRARHSLTRAHATTLTSAAHTLGPEAERSFVLESARQAALRTHQHHERIGLLLAQMRQHVQLDLEQVQHMITRFPRSALFAMLRSGAKGGAGDLAELLCSIGPQGGDGYVMQPLLGPWRFSPHQPIISNSAQCFRDAVTVASVGYCQGNFTRGVSISEYVAMACTGRKQVADSSKLVYSPGELQRDLTSVLTPISVGPGGTIVHSNGLLLALHHNAHAETPPRATPCITWPASLNPAESPLGGEDELCTARQRYATAGWPARRDEREDAPSSWACLSTATREKYARSPERRESYRQAWLQYKNRLARMHEAMQQHAVAGETSWVCFVDIGAFLADAREHALPRMQSLGLEESVLADTDPLEVLQAAEELLQCLADAEFDLLCHSKQAQQQQPQLMTMQGYLEQRHPLLVWYMYSEFHPRQMLLVHRITSIELKLLLWKLPRLYRRSVVEAGTNVGGVAASSVCELCTQGTLNTKHEVTTADTKQQSVPEQLKSLLRLSYAPDPLSMEIRVRADRLPEFLGLDARLSGDEFTAHVHAISVMLGEIVPAALLRSAECVHASDVPALAQAGTPPAVALNGMVHEAAWMPAFCSMAHDKCSALVHRRQFGLHLAVDAMQCWRHAVAPQYIMFRLISCIPAFLGYATVLETTAQLQAGRSPGIPPLPSQFLHFFVYAQRAAKMDDTMQRNLGDALGPAQDFTLMDSLRQALLARVSVPSPFISVIPTAGDERHLTLLLQPDAHTPEALSHILDLPFLDETSVKYPHPQMISYMYGIDAGVCAMLISIYEVSPDFRKLAPIHLDVIASWMAVRGVLLRYDFYSYRKMVDDHVERIAYNRNGEVVRTCAVNGTQSHLDGVYAPLLFGKPPRHADLHGEAFSIQHTGYGNALFTHKNVSH